MGATILSLLQEQCSYLLSLFSVLKNKSNGFDHFSVRQTCLSSEKLAFFSSVFVIFLPQSVNQSLTFNFLLFVLATSPVRKIYMMLAPPPCSPGNAEARLSGFTLVEVLLVSLFLFLNLKELLVHSLTGGHEEQE